MSVLEKREKFKILLYLRASLGDSRLLDFTSEKTRLMFSCKEDYGHKSSSGCMF